jgi:hypothetical protein
MWPRLLFPVRFQEGGETPEIPSLPEEVITPQAEGFWQRSLWPTIRESLFGGGQGSLPGLADVMGFQRPGWMQPRAGEQSFQTMTGGISPLDIATAAPTSAMVKSFGAAEVAAEGKNPLLTRVSRNGSEISISFDATGRVPTPEELEQIFGNHGYKVGVTKFKTDLVSAANGEHNYRIDVWDEKNRLSGDLAGKAMTHLFGADEPFSMKTQFQKAYPVRERFGAAYEYGTKKMEQLDEPAPSPPESGYQQGGDVWSSLPDALRQAFPMVRGMVEPGNIDLNRRAVLMHPDYSFSTELSFSINEGGNEVLLPQIIGGQLVSKKDAIKFYHETGEHLGKFESPEAADAYARSLHERQSAFYQGKQEGGEVLEPVADTERFPFVRKTPYEVSGLMDVPPFNPQHSPQSISEIEGVEKTATFEIDGKEYVLPSQIFGRPTTRDERLWFFQHGIFDPFWRGGEIW